MCAHARRAGTNPRRHNTPPLCIPAKRWNSILARSATVDWRSSFSAGQQHPQPFSPSRCEIAATRSRELLAAHHAWVRAPRSDGLRARQRGGLDQVVRLVLAGPHAIGAESAAPASVLKRTSTVTPLVLRQHVAGALRGGRRLFSAIGTAGDRIDGESSVAASTTGGDHRDRPAHVGGHGGIEAASRWRCHRCSKVTSADQRHR